MPSPGTEDERRATETLSRPKKKKSKKLSPMIGAAAGAAVIVVVIVGSLLPQVAMRASVKLAPPVPDVVSLWGGRLDAPGVQAYVNRVATDVATKSPAIGAVTVHVTQDAAAHAVAMPGREIVITAGLLRRLSSEAQLAALIAHLIAHIESGEVDKAFLEGKEADLRVRARTAGTTPSNAERERGFTVRTGELMEAAGFITAAFPDAHGALSARSGRLSSFVQQHPVPPDALTAIRTAAEGGRSADIDYTRNVLDPLGRAAAPPPERSVNPPLPPKPPPTPKLDLSRPSDRVKREGMPQPPPRKPGATFEPPAPPL